jgi:uncharacterized membrane protein
MMFAALFLWIALIALAIWGAGRLFPALGQREAPDRGATTLEILTRRYARGEISREEFQTMKDDILRSRKSYTQ